VFDPTIFTVDFIGSMPGVDPFAVTSLLLQLVSGCLYGIRAVSQMKGTKDEVRSAVLMLRLEEYRLSTWSLRSGASDGVLHPQLDANITHQTLKQIQSLICDSDALCSSYGLAFQEGQAEIVTAPASSGSVTRGRTFPTFLRRKEKATTFPQLQRRLTWVLKDEAKFSRLITTISSLIDTLHQGLGDINLDTIREDVSFLRLQMVNLADKIEDVQSVGRAIEINDGPNSDACTCAAVKRCG
jgi:hypothetical protein